MGAEAPGQIISLGGHQVSPELRIKGRSPSGIWRGRVGLLLSSGRTLEFEADRIGLTLMAKAGYDPARAIAFWQRMAKIAGDKPPQILST